MEPCVQSNGRQLRGTGANPFWVSLFWSSLDLSIRIGFPLSLSLSLHSLLIPLPSLSFSLCHWWCFEHTKRNIWQLIPSFFCKYSTVSLIMKSTFIIWVQTWCASLPNFVSWYGKILIDWLIGWKTTGGLESDLRAYLRSRCFLMQIASHQVWSVPNSWPSLRSQNG